MPGIHLLDETTINKIAAGEVIERPASVVKELIENSIDAGATDIRIYVEKGGKKLIRVTDNGCGMDREDAALAFVKHSTSKIQKIEDIEHVMTMGFRGEALSSICAVAKVEILTKTNEGIGGTRVIIHGGKSISISDAGAPAGTSVTVEELFFNTPARKKYLKSDSTELAHIIDAVSRNAIGHNRVSFTLIHNGKELIRSPASELKETILHLYGQEVARAMLPVDFTSRFATISGVISRPEVTRGTMDSQSFFINTRNVTSRAFNFALRKGYGTLLPQGRFPIAALKISVDINEVDVNVHPTKNQVRLSHEWEISESVTMAVRGALSDRDLVPSVRTAQMLLNEEKENPQVIREEKIPFRASAKDTERRIRRTEKEAGKKSVYEPPEVKVIGQVGSLYVIAETKEGLMILDQHAAHERILFEQVRDSKREDSQELIVPVNLELDAKEKVLVKECIPFLEEFGFRISDFGPDAYAITAVPRVLGRMEDPELVHDIITDVISEGKIKDETGIFERVTRSIACRGAIKAGAECSAEQMERLIEQLFRVENPYTCPHGRPTMISFNREELDRLFKRS